MTNTQKWTEETATEHAASQERVPVFVYENSDGTLTGYQGEGKDILKVRAQTPFALHSELDREGAPTPRNFYLIED